MKIKEAIKLTVGDRSQDRQRFYDIGKACEFELPPEYAPVSGSMSEALYFATEFGFLACPREKLPRGEDIAYGALREGIISAAYVRLLKLSDNIKPVKP